MGFNIVSRYGKMPFILFYRYVFRITFRIKVLFDVILPKNNTLMQMWLIIPCHS